tara:strand:- start:3224 stop:3484 length:261 start_codon:yes stop_codon:yes gene_type:complete
MWENVLKGERLTMADIRKVYDALSSEPKTIREIANYMGVHFNTVKAAMKKILIRREIYPGVQKKEVGIQSPGKTYERIKYAYYIGK